MSSVENNTEDKKEEFKLPDSMKIWCATKEYATRVQKKLFSLGCKWGDSSTKVWHPIGESEFAIYWRDSKLTYDETRVYFEDQEIDEYILDETLTTCFVKVPKENEEDVSADSISPDSFGVAEDKVNEGIYIEPKPSLWERLKLSNLIKRKELWKCY